METARSLVIRALKEGGEVLPKLMKLIGDESVPDPKGVIKDAVLYTLEEKHDFTAVCQHIQQWQKWTWGRGFLSRMEKRVNAESTATEVEDRDLMKRLQELVELYQANHPPIRRSAVIPNRMVEMTNRVNNVEKPTPKPVNSSKPSSRFTFQPSQVVIEEKPAASTETVTNNEKRTQAEKPHTIVSKPSVLRDAPANIELTMQQKVRRADQLHQKASMGGEFQSVAATKTSFLPPLPELPKIRVNDDPVPVSAPPPPANNNLAPKGLFGFLNEKNISEEKESSLLPIEELTFHSKSPVRPKKEVVIQSSIKLINKVQSELSSLRPRTRYLPPDPNELYSERTKQQISQLRREYQPHVAQTNLWQELHALHCCGDVLEEAQTAWKNASSKPQ